MKGKVILAKKSDAKELLKIYSQESHLEGVEGISYKIENIQDYITRPGNKMFIYKINKEIVGFLLVEFYVDYVFLHTMAVKKEFRGKGIATTLMRHLETMIAKKDIRLIEAITETENKEMRKIFEKEGYDRGKKFFYYAKVL